MEGLVEKREILCACHRYTVRQITLNDRSTILRAFAVPGTRAVPVLKGNGQHESV